MVTGIEITHLHEVIAVSVVIIRGARGRLAVVHLLVNSC